MALELDATVTAEGVETAAELDTLRSLGVDTVQGYLLARPSTDRGVGRLGEPQLAHPPGDDRTTRPDPAERRT